MNTNHKKSPAIPAIAPDRSILGATGLSRASLRSMFSARGLFGAESALSAREQAGVYAELRLPAGSVPPAAPTSEVVNHVRIALIRSVAAVILRQDTQWYGRQVALARRFGVQDEVLSEVARTVRTAMLVFGAAKPVHRDIEDATVASMGSVNDRSALLAAA